MSIQAVQMIILWLFVINLGTAFGAGLYESRVVVPQWLRASPGSGYRWNAEAAQEADVGLKFWVYVTTVPLTLLTVASLAAAWWTPEPVTRLVGRVKSVRFLSPDVALMHVIGGTVMRGESKPSPVRDSIQTLVATRKDSRWKLAAFQNTRVRPMGRSFGAVLLWIVTDLLWKLLLRKSDMASEGPFP